MSFKGWIFVVALLGLAVLVKPTLRVAWPGNDPGIEASDNEDSVASDGSQDASAADERFAAATPPPVQSESSNPDAEHSSDRSTGDQTATGAIDAGRDGSSPAMSAGDSAQAARPNSPDQQPGTTRQTEAPSATSPVAADDQTATGAMDGGRDGSSPAMSAGDGAQAARPNSPDQQLATTRQAEAPSATSPIAAGDQTATGAIDGGRDGSSPAASASDSAQTARPNSPDQQPGTTHQADAVAASATSPTNEVQQAAPALPTDARQAPEVAQSAITDDRARREPRLEQTDGNLAPVTVASIPVTAPDTSADQARRSAEMAAAAAQERLEAELQTTSDLSAQLANAQTELGQLRGELTSAQAKSEEWQKAAEQAKADVASARDDIAHARSDAAAVADQREADARSAASQAGALQHQLDDAQSRATVLASDLEAARVQLADADRQRLAAADDRRLADAASNAASTELQAKLQDEQQKNAGLTQRLASAEATIRELQEQAKKVQASAITGHLPPVPAGRSRTLKVGPEAKLEPQIPADAQTKGRAAVTNDRAEDPRRVQPRRHDPDAGKSASREVSPRDRRPTAAAPNTASTNGKPADDHVAYAPDRPEAFSSDDYSPYDTSDHTVYIDDVVATPSRKCRASHCTVAHAAAVRIAKRAEVVR